jgi:hypothetical protein
MEVTTIPVKTPWEIINIKIKTNRHVGTAPFLDIVKRIAANASGKTNPVLDSMDPLIGPNQRKLQPMKTQRNRNPREQLERCIQVNWLVFFRVFNEGHS